MKKLLSICFLFILTSVLNAQVSKTVSVTTAGTLSTLLTPTEKTTLTDLTITGNIDARDFLTLRNMPKIEYIDIESTNIVSFTGTGGTDFFNASTIYPANTIPKYAFGWNNWNNRKTSLLKIFLPNNLIVIDEHAFDGCINLMNVDFPNTLESIGEYAFFLCSNIQTVIFPPLVSEIKIATFSNCTNLKNISLTTSISKIHSAAFSMCNSLETLNIPFSVNYIDYEAFSNCNSLNNINVDIQNQFLCSIDGVLYSKDRKRLLKYPSGRDGDFVIPNDVKVIDKYSFNTSYKLNNVTLSIGIDSILVGAFRECTRLTSIQFPPTVKFLGEAVFMWCSNLNNISLSDSIKMIGIGTFYGCSGLREINLPNKIDSIHSGAFGDCTSLTNITIPNSVVYIGVNSFSRCYALNSIQLSNKLNSIGNNAFDGDTNLNSIILKSNIPPLVGSNVFDGVNKASCILTVPNGTKTVYNRAYVWREFYNINEDLTTNLSKHQNSELRIYRDYSFIIIDGLKKNSTAILYTLDGRQEQSFKSSGKRLFIPAKSNTIYLLKTEGKAYKLML